MTAIPIKPVYYETARGVEEIGAARTWGEAREIANERRLELDPEHESEGPNGFFLSAPRNADGTSRTIQSSMLIRLTPKEPR